MATGPSPTRDLIYDVGLHRGEDTAFYLAKGYRVVAFEANPDLVDACTKRFGDAIAAGRLTIVSGAITDAAESGVTFYRHAELSVWGTTDPEWAARNEPVGGSSSVTVPAVSFPEQLERHGVPWYLKVDIEGADRLCLEALRDAPATPAYASLEADMESAEAVASELDLLEEVGFDSFVAVQQATIPGREIETRALDGSPVHHRFEPDASGPFGEDLEGWGSRAATQADYRRLLRRYRRVGPSSPLGRFGPTRHLVHLTGQIIGVPLPGWCDTHARRTAAAGD
jgi:FkbM family methyltransferase